MPTFVKIFIGMVLVGPFLLLLLMKWLVNLNTRHIEDWKLDPFEAWKKNKPWSKGQVVGVPFYLAKYSPLYGLVVAGPLTRFLLMSYGDDKYHIAVIFCGFVLASYPLVYFWRHFVFCFADAGRIGGKLQGELTGPWRLFFGRQITVALVCTKVDSRGTKTEQVYEQQAKVSTQSPIKIDFFVPNGKPTANPFGIEKVIWSLDVHSTSGYMLPLSFSIPVVRSKDAQVAA
jgi:hypothetical protein